MPHSEPRNATAPGSAPTCPSAGACFGRFHARPIPAFNIGGQLAYSYPDRAPNVSMSISCHEMWMCLEHSSSEVNEKHAKTRGLLAFASRKAKILGSSLRFPRSFPEAVMGTPRLRNSRMSFSRLKDIESRCSMIIPPFVNLKLAPIFKLCA